MRLRRLGLSRYGMFTDHMINFGERIDGSPDLHIVYGANETGKSTALGGFLDLLFGIEPRSRYSFLHGYEAMRIESDLEISEQTYRLVRVRKTKASPARRAWPAYYRWRHRQRAWWHGSRRLQGNVLA